MLYYEQPYYGMDFIDDVNSGKTLPKQGMITARIEEVKFFKKMGVDLTEQFLRRQLPRVKD